MRGDQRRTLDALREEALEKFVLKLQAYGRMVVAKMLFKRMKSMKAACDEALESRDLSLLSSVTERIENDTFTLNIYKEYVISRVSQMHAVVHVLPPCRH